MVKLVNLLGTNGVLFLREEVLFLREEGNSIIYYNHYTIDGVVLFMCNEYNTNGVVLFMCNESNTNMILC